MLNKLVRVAKGESVTKSKVWIDVHVESITVPSKSVEGTTTFAVGFERGTRSKFSTGKTSTPSSGLRTLFEFNEVLSLSATIYSEKAKYFEKTGKLIVRDISLGETRSAIIVSFPLPLHEYVYGVTNQSLTLRFKYQHLDGCELNVSISTKFGEPGDDSDRLSVASSVIGSTVSYDDFRETRRPSSLFSSGTLSATNRSLVSHYPPKSSDQSSQFDTQQLLEEIKVLRIQLDSSKCDNESLEQKMNDATKEIHLLHNSLSFLQSSPSPPLPPLDHIPPSSTPSTSIPPPLSISLPLSLSLLSGSSPIPEPSSLPFQQTTETNNSSNLHSHLSSFPSESSPPPPNSPSPPSPSLDPLNVTNTPPTITSTDLSIQIQSLNQEHSRLMQEKEKENQQTLSSLSEALAAQSLSQSQLSSLRTDLQSLQGQLLSSERERSSQRADLSDLESQLSALETRLQISEEELLRLRRERQESDRKEALERDQQLHFHQEREGLLRQMEDLRVQRDEALASLQSLETLKTQSRSDVHDLVSTMTACESLSVKLTEYEEKNRLLERKLAKYRGIIEKQEADNRAAQELLEQKQKTIEELEASELRWRKKCNSQSEMILNLVDHGREFDLVH